MSAKQHWEQVYATKAVDAVSWYQPHAETSVRMIEASGVPHSAAIIDVGGGASVLVDDLMARGYDNLTVLDLSGAALDAARARLGASADRVCWIEADITDVSLPVHAYDLWHDRAAFHFLTAIEDRRAYVARLRQAVKPGGQAIIATFAEDGPEKCSGLPVVRYGVETLQAAFGAGFALVEHRRESHRTPFGTVQSFLYARFRLLGD